MHRDGKGIETNNEKYIYWLKKSSGNDYLDAHKKLGFIYALGKAGLKENQEKAFHYYKLAADKGDLEAKTFIADRLWME